MGTEISMSRAAGYCQLQLSSESTAYGDVACHQQSKCLFSL